VTVRFYNNNNNNLCALFIYVLGSTASGQFRIQHEYKKQQQQDNTGQNKEKATKETTTNKEKWVR
jgi:hypothetical protein